MEDAPSNGGNAPVSIRPSTPAVDELAVRQNKKLNITQLTEQIKSTHDSKPFSDENMKKLVDGTSFTLPPSYLYFVSNFGNGDTQGLQSYQIFDQDIDSPEEVGNFSKGNPDAPKFVTLQGGNQLLRVRYFAL